MVLSLFTFYFLGIEPNNFKAAKVTQKVGKDVHIATFPSFFLWSALLPIYPSAQAGKIR